MCVVVNSSRESDRSRPPCKRTPRHGAGAKLNSTIIVHRLDQSQRRRLADHLLALEPADVRLRFGYSMTPEAIERYVADIDFGTDTVFAVLDDDLSLLGAAHLAFADQEAELGVSVLARCRGRGVGSALFARAEEHARNRFVSRLFMHCLAENAAMMRIARRAGMDIAMEAGDAEAFLHLEAPTPASVAGEFIQHRVALLDYGLKMQLTTLTRVSTVAVDAIQAGGRVDDGPDADETSADQAPGEPAVGQPPVDGRIQRGGA